jgi:hypothetical protein
MTTMDLPNDKNEKKKQLLTVDLYVQLLIILISMIAFFGDPMMGFGGIYLVLGGYQLISSLIHLAFKPISGLRKAYYPQLIIHLVLLGIGIAGESIELLYIELFATALTALYYLTVTIVDFVDIKK